MVSNEIPLAFRYISAAVWFGLFLLTAFAIALLGSFPVWLSALVSLALWGPYWLLGWLPIVLSKQFPISRQHLKKALGIHLLGAIVFVFAAESIFFVAMTELRPSLVREVAENNRSTDVFDEAPPLRESLDELDGVTRFFSVMLFKAQSSFPLYWLLVAIAHGLSALVSLRIREQQSAELQTRLARAELAQLRTQLQPHFLFNTLNSVMVLLEDSPQAAREMLWDLSELLRMILKQPDTDRISLRQELELLNHYVGIQKIRFGDRLQFMQQIDDAALAFNVPPLLLQPLVENAIRHGIEATGRAAVVSLRVQHQPATDSIAVMLENRDADASHTAADTGNAAASAAVNATASGGLGLRNTRARLEAEFGDSYRFSAGWQAGTTYQVSMELPQSHQKPSSPAVTP